MTVRKRNITKTESTPAACYLREKGTKKMTINKPTDMGMAVARKTFAAELVIDGSFDADVIVDAVNWAFPDMEPAFHRGRVHVVMAELNRGARAGFVKPITLYRYRLPRCEHPRIED